MKQASNTQLAADADKPPSMRYLFDDGSMLFRAEKI
jgi:hypothetical protein